MDLDALVTYAYDLTLGGGAFYIGTSLLLYLSKRWQQLEVKPKAVNIPLALKAAESDALPLTLEIQESKPLEAIPSEPIAFDDQATPELGRLSAPFSAPPTQLE